MITDGNRFNISADVASHDRVAVVAMTRHHINMTRKTSTDNAIKRRPESLFFNPVNVAAGMIGALLLFARERLDRGRVLCADL